MSRVEPASSADLQPIRSLLEASGLPTDDLIAASPQFFVIREPGRIVAIGALERFGSAALLRSVAVTADRRGRGYGRRMTRELERAALNCGISQLILLTDTAAAFFEREGYRVIERHAAPPAMQQCAEFRSLCPSSASCLAKTLRASESRSV
jgi:amino-acid N-acetyltransferase